MAHKVFDSITWKDLKSGVVILHIDSGDYFTLNDSASQIWYGIVAGKEDQEIIQGLAEMYDAPLEEMAKDYGETIDLLRRENVID
jgi:hypothetical protein